MRLYFIKRPVGEAHSPGSNNRTAKPLVPPCRPARGRGPGENPPRRQALRCPAFWTLALGPPPGSEPQSAAGGPGGQC